MTAAVRVLPALVPGGLAVAAWAGVPAGPQALASGAAVATLAPAESLVGLLGALALLIAAARASAALFRRLGQPEVLGELLVGLALGPSLLGRLWPEATVALLAGQTGAGLRVIAQLGIILYLFVVGLELDFDALRKEATRVAAISSVGTAAAFVAGSGCALALYARFAGPGVPFPVFAVFLGLAAAATSFPVVSRMLADLEADQTSFARFAVATAAAQDLLAWGLFAVAVELALHGAHRVWLPVLIALGYPALLVAIGVPFSRWSSGRSAGVCSPVSRGGLALVFVAVLAGCLTASWAGLRAATGAFLVGALISPHCAVAQLLSRRLRELLIVVFLPAFFALIGLRTRLDVLGGAREWLWFGALLGLFWTAAFASTALAARWTGLSPRQSAGLGVLMNTRGLLMLFALTVGLDLGVLTNRLFSLLVLVMVASTALAAAAARRIVRPEELRGAAGAHGRRALTAVGGTVCASAALLFLFFSWGRGLEAAAGVGWQPHRLAAGVLAFGTTARVRELLVALTTVILVARLLSAVFARVGQPPVIGEMLAGIALGPSLLGAVWPSGFAALLPASVVPQLAVVAHLGILLYMFLVGLELDHEAVREKGRALAVVSNASIAVPLLFGAVLAIFLYGAFAGPNVSRSVFALFVGIALSVTAFPVLARILSDTGLRGTPLGVAALTCAAAGDLTAWCLLAVAVSLANPAGGSPLATAALTAGFLALVFVAGRPFVNWAVTRYGERPPTRAAVALTFVGLLACAAATEAIGIHAIFGAFLFGALIPTGSPLAHSLRAGLEDLVVVLFLPAFFAFTGLRTHIGLVSGSGAWLLTVALVLVATLGKFAGATLPARWAGFSWKEAGALGALMNTRGLMELLILNLGLDLGILSPRLFAMMVLMTLATTLMTSPALRLFGATPGSSSAAT